MAIATSTRSLGEEGPRRSTRRTGANLTAVAGGGEGALCYGPRMARPAADRLGWTRAPRASVAEWPRLAALAREIRRDGLTRTLVLGMGGSSLAPAVLARSFGKTAALQVLDSTDPAAVLAAERTADPSRTLYVVTSKSGTTVETLAFYRYFAARARPGQFIAITDPGTPLETLAREQGFRAVFAHPA